MFSIFFHFHFSLLLPLRKQFHKHGLLRSPQWRDMTNTHTIAMLSITVHHMTH